MEFKIVKNTLASKAAIKLIRIKNENYTITIYYYGDYGKDVIEKNCCVDNISMSCKSINTDIDLLYLHGVLALDMSLNQQLLMNQFDNFIMQFNKAKNSLIELQSFIQEYFPYS